MLHSIQEHPPLYRRPEFQYLCDFVDLVSSNRVIFPEMEGDIHVQLSSVVENGEVSISTLTKGLVRLLANDTHLTIIRGCNGENAKKISLILMKIGDLMVIVFIEVYLKFQVKILIKSLFFS